GRRANGSLAAALCGDGNRPPPPGTQGRARRTGARSAMLILVQVLLAFAVEGTGAVRFGFPLPERALARGLAVEGAPALALQWRPVQAAPDPLTGRIWCEIAVGGPGMACAERKELRVRAGRIGPTPDRAGPVYRWTRDVAEQEGVQTTTTT